MTANVDTSEIRVELELTLDQALFLQQLLGYVSRDAFPAEMALSTDLRDSFGEVDEYALEFEDEWGLPADDQGLAISKASNYDEVIEATKQRLSTQLKYIKQPE